MVYLLEAATAREGIDHTHPGLGFKVIGHLRKAYLRAVVEKIIDKFRGLRTMYARRACVPLDKPLRHIDLRPKAWPVIPGFGRAVEVGQDILVEFFHFLDHGPRERVAVESHR